jgi:hypothetical protein
MTSSTRLWFALLAAPAAWAIAGLAGWGVGSRICTSMSIGSVRLVLGAISAVALAVAVAGLFVAAGNWRITSMAPDVAGDRMAFMAAGGAFVSVAFVIGLIWFGLNTVLVDTCGGMR